MTVQVNNNFLLLSQQGLRNTSFIQKKLQGPNLQQFVLKLLNWKIQRLSEGKLHVHFGPRRWDPETYCTWNTQSCSSNLWFRKWFCHILSGFTGLKYVSFSAWHHQTWGCQTCWGSTTQRFFFSPAVSKTANSKLQQLEFFVPHVCSAGALPNPRSWNQKWAGKPCRFQLVEVFGPRIEIRNIFLNPFMDRKTVQTSTPAGFQLQH